MNAIERLPPGMAASLRAALLAVTVEDICRILFLHALSYCHDELGSSSGSIGISVDYATWSITATLEVDQKDQLSSQRAPLTSPSDPNELELLSHLGLLHITLITAADTTVCIWRDGQKSRSKLPADSLVAPPNSAPAVSGRGVRIALRDVFSKMQVRRKFIASEALKRRHIDSLIRCVEEQSLLAPEAHIRLSLCRAPRIDANIPAFRTILSLPRAKDLVHRCQAMFGADGFEALSIRRIASKRKFTGVSMKVNGFLCLVPTANALQAVFFQGRTWPGAPSRGGLQRTERGSAIFASLLSTFELAWTDEPANRHTWQKSLTPDLYKQICQRMTRIPEAIMPDKGTQASYSYVLNITLSPLSGDEQVEKQADATSSLTVDSFLATLLDVICSRSSMAASSTPCKRRRTDRPTSAVELEAYEGGISPLRSRAAITALALESFAADAAPPDGMVEWRDPMSGRIFHIDRRTGHSMAVEMEGARADEGDLHLARRVRSPHRGIVNRASLNKGLNLELSKGKPVADDAVESNDEFDDPALDAALASIYSPCPVPCVDTTRQSRFFDSRRCIAPTKPTPFRDLPPLNAAHTTTHSKTSELEQTVSRADLQEATVLNQVDEKFILCSTAPSTSRNAVLFCVDQHAADERYRLERLLEGYVADSVAGVGGHALRSSVTLAVTVKQCELVLGDKGLKQGLERLGWGISDMVVIHAALDHAQVDLNAIPSILREKVLSDSGRVKGLDLLQSSFVNCLEEIASCLNPLEADDTSSNGVDWVIRSRRFPTSLMDVMKSTACRSAIMFNDPLSKEAAERVVRRLAECRFPFSCAHGRPSLVPLCEVRTFQQGEARE
ncbi:related to MLH3 - insertion and deletion mismatch repair protein [Melanopsichium pennsylvanicum]|uniref:Related to MLH3 - insertion and deletion mismatch repair protein n=2 Tax=Melanopsichium pennsylvanicum TaxID=63383 RepID=A0AAJ5C6L4_9BASI|nr:related to MLH3-insertion and deletion mismatch repair protein [Melanopsichium pennsylvanicum 4]SNX85966.1 related to MLH3 - insertion and deletion mismatch repair protein [Melanopsichium pennsylvanicum]